MTKVQENRIKKVLHCSGIESVRERVELNEYSELLHIRICTAIRFVDFDEKRVLEIIKDYKESKDD